MISHRHRVCMAVCLRSAVLLVLVWVGPGCSTTSPIRAWQNRVTRYVIDVGRGDPAVLREAADWRSPQRLRPSRIDFAHRSNPGLPGIGRPVDVRGVLVGVQQAGDRNWYVFLVGVSRQGKGTEVRDVRPAAFTAEEGKLLWRIGERDPTALKRYRSIIAERQAAPDDHIGSVRMVPAETDVYTMDLNDGELTLTERGTGATWRLWLGPEGRDAERRPKHASASSVDAMRAEFP